MTKDNTAIEKRKERENPHVIGTRPQHTHACGHQCNSPYCGGEANIIDCETCGGPPCVVQGFEPWRGRS